MVDQAAINRRQRQFEDKGKAEILKAPEIIQATQALRFMPRIRRAITTAAAGASATITANLYDPNGIELTTGKGSDITVYCSIIGGTKLNEAIPALADNTDIFVIKLPYDNDGTPEMRWYIPFPFQTYNTQMFAVTSNILKHLYDNTMFNYENDKLGSNLNECV